VADDLADDDVRVVLACGGQQPLEPVGRHAVVVVGEEHVLAAGEAEADVARLARPPRVRDVLDAHVGVRRRQRVEDGAAAVGRAVVDEDQLERPGRERLREQRVDAGRQLLARVEDRDHDAHLGPGHGRSS
jgi:hypothetical protein